MVLMFLLVLSAALVFFLIQYSALFLPAPAGVRVLMYHKVEPEHSDSLTVNKHQLEQHLQYIKENNFQVVSLQQVLDHYVHGASLPKRSVLLTFDDGFLNNLLHAIPLLNKYTMPAVFFIATDFTQRSMRGETDYLPYMDVHALKELRNKGGEIALHSHTHRNFGTLSSTEINDEIVGNTRFMITHGIPFTPAFAYPFGARPKGRKELRQMKTLFREAGIQLAFRIGNRINPFSRPRDIFELQRIDIKGTDSFKTFTNKVNKGRIKRF